METYYKKVEIKSEADLPKRTDSFWAYSKEDEMHFLDYEYFHDDYPTEDKNYWMDNIAWYLLPVEEPQNVESEVPVLTDLSEDDRKSTIDQFVRMTAKATLELFMMLGLKTHIECMVKNEPTNQEFIFSFRTVESHASQFTQQRQVSDEDIYSAADKKSCVCDEDEPEHERIEIQLWEGFVNGAKWMRDQMTIKSK